MLTESLRQPLFIEESVTPGTRLEKYASLSPFVESKYLTARHTPGVEAPATSVYCVVLKYAEKVYVLLGASPVGV